MIKLMHKFCAADCIQSFRIRTLLVLIVAAPATSLAICLNPFGCAPKTQAECIKEAASAKTEIAAKAMIYECRKLPKVTFSQCQAVEKQWAQHLSSHGGVEWDWSERATKFECKKSFPLTFSPELWINTSYCEANVKRLAEVQAEVDATSKKSLRLEQARRKIPELVKLDDWQAVEVLQSVYYQDMSSAELAAGVFIDAPPEPLAVAAACKKITNRSGAK